MLLQRQNTVQYIIRADFASQEVSERSLNPTVQSALRYLAIMTNKSGLALNRTRPPVNNQMTNHPDYGDGCDDGSGFGGGGGPGTGPGEGPHSFTNSESVRPTGGTIS